MACAAIVVAIDHRRAVRDLNIGLKTVLLRWRSYSDLAEVLVREGVPFREAHGTVGGLVSEAEQRGVDVSEIARERFGIKLTVAGALRSKRALGGTAPARVRRALAAWQSVPAVSTMSSIITQFLPSTSPMIFMTSD